MSGVDEQTLRLFRTQPAHSYQAPLCWRTLGWDRVKWRLQAAVHDVYFGPILVAHKPEKLPARERANGHHEGTSSNLFGEAEKSRVLKSSYPVGGEAPRRSAQCMHEHRYFGRIGAEMGMQVLDALLAQPSLDEACLNKVGKVDGKSALCSLAHAAGQY